MTEAPSPRIGSGDGLLRRTNVLAGLMFIAFAALGLWLSRDYPIGTAVRMNTGYVPRLLCWLLGALGALILLQGLRGDASTVARGPAPWRALILIPASLVAFALAIGPLGVVAAIVLLVALGALASDESRILEAGAIALVLIALTLIAFVWALGLTIPVWPGN